MRVAVTRPKERAEDTIKLIEDRGWEAQIVPSVEIVPRKRPSVRLDEYDWLILTSASGAEIIHDYYGDELKKVKIAVIGPKTAEILRKRDIEVELVPREYKAESLAGELLAKGIKDKKILIARAAIGRKELVEMLEGEAKAEEVHLYDTKKPAEGGELKKFSIALRKGKIDAIIFTSSQAARNVLSMLGKNALLLNNIKVCAIGPVTACTLEKAGIRVDATPDKYTVQSCLDALEKIM